MLFNIPHCKSQAPVTAAAAVAAISSPRFSSASLPLPLPALVPPPPPTPLPEESPFTALLASDPAPPEPLRQVLATGDVHAALRGLPGLARQLFRWAEATPRGFPRSASAFAAVLVPLAHANHIRAAYPVSLRALHLGLLLPVLSLLLAAPLSPALRSLLSLLLRLSAKFSTEREARDATPAACSTLCLAAFRVVAGHGVAPDVRDCNRVLRVLRDAARWDDVRAVYGEMLQLGIEPTIVTYNTLLDSFLKEGRKDEASMLLKEMETQGGGCLLNDVTYNVVISFLAREGHLEDAAKLVDSMRLSKKASSFTYNPLITALLERGFVQKVEALQMEMENEGIMPTVVTYNAIIHGLLKSEQVEAAQLKFAEMRAMGLLPDLITYNSLLNGYCKAGNLKEAHWLLGDLRRAGLAPTVLTYNTLIDGYCRLGDLEEARRLKEEMVEQGCFPDVCTYTILMNGSHKVRNLPMAREFFDEMLSKGLQPDCFAYNTRICAS
ncbi:unnamed protein product [Miscanthus lutarioriparius]|uniref:Pentatricopeptide repeat-containing protein n=1 Tax=Miscanthus lutarioriparius TaxID=422564 RepID=A0A811QIL8_9POAL|nr:unnamed protein product [Miscanthus lutarioriparius]